MVYFDGSQIKIAAKKKGWTLGDTAKAIGTYEERVRKWTSKNGSAPNGHEIARLANVLDVEVTFFYPTL